MTETSSSELATDGARIFQGALKPCLAELEAALANLPSDEAGVRIQGIDALKPWLARAGRIGAIAASVLGEGARPVRAILFNKSPKANWSLAWHQDRTICVKAKRDVAGYGPWTVKRGMHHVEPPFELLARMVTLRAHLDDVPSTNAPLLIAPGSHLFGRIAVGDVDEIAKRCGTKACLAHAGDVWLYATPLLHASEAATAPTRRRVLQVDFSVDVLPGGLEWLGF
ncbi:phytanoyl-CoA dioxygenase family protein [Sphingomonas sp. ASV193]|uniref:phytanoyl-CoA dioxygenase family protein n=1 Tax=Sphingomonas sp. ASV193 TaxID=3144405 RepID=UPI0032E8D0DA